MLTYAALTSALNEPDGLGITKTLRAIELKRAEDELFTADKIARLRSGARGFDARKFLRVQEKATEVARLALEAFLFFPVVCLFFVIIWLKSSLLAALTFRWFHFLSCDLSGPKSCQRPRG